MLNRPSKPSVAKRHWQIFVTAAVMSCLGCGSQSDSSATVEEINDAHQEVKLLIQSDELEKAILKYEDLLTLADHLQEDRNTVRALILYDLGTLCLKSGDYTKATLSLAESLALRKEVNPDRDDHIRKTMLYLAKAYTLSGDLNSAESLFTKTQRAIEAARDSDDLPLAECLTSFGDLYSMKGLFQQAEATLVRALDIYEKELPPDHHRTVLAQIRLADVYRAMARYEEAHSLCEKSITLARSDQRPDGALMASILSIRGKVLIDTGRYEEARQDFNRCLKSQQQLFRPNHPELATTLSNLAGIADISGKFPEAELLYQRSLKIAEAAYGEAHPHVGVIRGNMSVLYSQVGDYEKAIVYAERSLQLCEASIGKYHPQTAMQYNTVAMLLHKAGRLKEAETLFLRSWDAIRKSQGSESPTAALVMCNLAAVYEDMGDADKSEQMYETALGIRAGRFGLNDPDAIDGLNNLGILYFRNGKVDKAGKMFEAARENAERTLGDDHPKLVSILINMAMYEESRNNLDAAVESADRARRIIRGHLPKVLLSLSLQEQKRFQEVSDYPSLDLALSMALAHPDNANVVEHSASWVLNAKGIRGSVFGERARLLHHPGHDVSTARKVREFVGIDRSIANLVVNAPEYATLQNHVSRLAALKKRRSQLRREIGFEMLGALEASEWVTLKSVRECITDDAILIEIVRVEPLNLREQKGHQRLTSTFVAWLITNDSSKPPKIVDLGDARRIEATIRDVRAALQNAPADIQALGEREAEAKLRATIEQLSDLVLAPLSKHLDGKPIWLVSPDGELWHIPWEMLTLGSKYVVEDHTVNYLISGRELLFTPDHRKPQVPLVVADPDFDALVDEPNGSSGAELGVTSPFYRAQAIDWATLQSVKWSRLPGTREEARRIIPVLSKWAEGQEVVALLGKDAREGAFKRLVNRPRVLVVSTHGFFVPFAHRSGREFGDIAPNEGRGIGGILTGGHKLKVGVETEVLQMLANNPLLQCGLVFAGANRRDSTNEPRQEDGILTGLEAASLNLAGTELVILSACETGLGEIHVGEGVASLRQSFLIAGSESVIATLWKVPDEETSVLVSNIVEGIAVGKSGGEALRAAQLEMISRRRKDDGAAHPLFWASFTQTGHWTYPNRFEYRKLRDSAWRLEERWSNGSPKVQCEMRLTDNGSLLRHGKCTQWHRNGVKKADGEFAAGQRSGKWVEWHDNGIKASDDSYKHGVLSGPFTDWNSEGETTMRGQYHDDELSGKIVMWEEEGLRVESVFRNGKRHGPSVVFSKDGVKVCETLFKNDLEHGTQTFWNESGEKKIFEREYSDGVLRKSNQFKGK
jgi:CHAT domain-containing protein/tetratricopeptide (TPR) repeat protein